MHNFVYHSLTVVSASAHNHNISLFLLSSFLPLYKWRTSVDGNTWERRGVLAPPKIGDLMDETMSARVYNDTLVIMTDGKGMEAFTTPAVGLTQDDPLKMEWSQGYEVNAYAGLNSSYVNVALRILPIDAAKPTHAAMGWKVEPQPTKQCHGQMTFAVFPLV